MAVAKIPGPAGRGPRAILSRDRTVDDEKFCTALPIHLRVQSMVCVSVSVSVCVVGGDRETCGRCDSCQLSLSLQSQQSPPTKS